MPSVNNTSLMTITNLLHVQCSILMLSITSTLSYVLSESSSLSVIHVLSVTVLSSSLLSIPPLLSSVPHSSVQNKQKCINICWNFQFTWAYVKVFVRHKCSKLSSRALKDSVAKAENESLNSVDEPESKICGSRFLPIQYAH